MTRGALVGLIAITAMWWLPALLSYLDRLHYQRPPERPMPPAEHTTPTQVRILRPGWDRSRELERWDDR